MSDDDPDGPGEDKRLVCGVCEELLEGTFAGEAAAEQAVSEHRARVHPDREEDEVVVVHVTTALVDMEGEEGVVDIAKGAQRRLEEGDVGEDLGMLGG